MNGLSLKVVFALAFALGGVNHFLNPRLYLSIMPPYIPWHGFWVVLTGIAEIGLGLLLLVPQAQSVAAWGLAALLVLVFPANLHMALNAQAYAVPAALLWLRLPLQIALVAWALAYR